jgi:hypothetical protein
MGTDREPQAGISGLIRANFWRATRKRACRWTPKKLAAIRAANAPSAPGNTRRSTLVSRLPSPIIRVNQGNLARSFPLAHPSGCIHAVFLAHAQGARLWLNKMLLCRMIKLIS